MLSYTARFQQDERVGSTNALPNYLLCSAIEKLQNAVTTKLSSPTLFDAIDIDLDLDLDLDLNLDLDLVQS